MLPEFTGYRKLVTVGLVAALFLTAGYFTAAPGQQFWRRSLLLFLVFATGLLVGSNLRIVPSLFAFATDAFFMTHGPNAADLLFWACFFAIPFLAAGLLEAEEKYGGSSSSEDSETNGPDSSGAEAGGLQVSSGPLDGSGSPEQVVDKLHRLLLDKLERGADKLGLANLLYYHVRNQKASLGYKINRLGEINQDLTFTADVGQSVGWVLRQEKSLTLRGQSLDWRNLQYHTRPVSLDRVEFHPVFSEEKLIGVLGLEWAETDKFDEAATGDFVEQSKKLLGLDYATRDLVKSQHKLELLEKLYTVNPLGGEDFADTVSRVVGFVRDYLPADHVKFLESGESLAEVSPPARRKIYESCRKWILNSGEILRIEDVRKESLGGQKLDRFAGSELRSFLGGAVRSDDTDCYGIIFLDSSDPDCFSHEDEKIFRLILNYLKQLLETAGQVRGARRRADQLSAWLNQLAGLPVATGHRRRCEEVCELLYENLDPLELALYYRNNSSFEVVSFKGEGDFDRVVDVDSSLVSSLNGSEKTLLTFPDVNKFADFEAPLDCESLSVLKVTGEKNRIRLFIILFFEERPELDEAEFDLFKQTSELIRSWLHLTSREMDALAKAAEDSATSFRQFNPWKRKVEEKLQKGSEEVVLWELRVPGLERVEEECGRKKAVSWLRSISRVVDEAFPESFICRSLGGNFYGYETSPNREEFEKIFQNIKLELEDWSFPAGDWPGEVGWELEIHSPPFPPVEKVLESLRYSRRRSDESEQSEGEPEKEPAG